MGISLKGVGSGRKKGRNRDKVAGNWGNGARTGIKRPEMGQKVG